MRLLVSIAFVLISLIARAGATLPHYRLHLTIHPLSHELIVEGEITHFPQSRVSDIYINKSFTFLVSAKKHPPLEIDHTSTSPDFMPLAKRVLISSKDISSLRFSYRGRVEEFVNDVNIISPSLVELSLYSSWYPHIKGLGQFTYELILDAPREFVFTANAPEVKRKEGEKSILYSFKTQSSVSDISLIGAPGLQARSVTYGNQTIRVYYPNKSRADINQTLLSLGDANKAFTEWFGPTGKGAIELVLSPRKGWGYSRLPLILTSNSYVESLLDPIFPVYQSSSSLPV